MNNKIKPKNKLSIERFNKLRVIFDSKKWPIEDVFMNNEFDKFHEMLEHLNDEEQDLILLLLNDFIKIEGSEYMKLFYPLFEEFAESAHERGNKRILLSPLIAPSDIGKTKSSTFLFYQIKSKISNLRVKFNYIEIECYDYHELLLKRLEQTDIICLVDDFIGTGETACSAVLNLCKNFLSAFEITDNIAVMILICQNEGLLKLHEIISKENVFAQITRNKGISDNYIDFKSKLSIMAKIEQRIKVKGKYSYGYKQSESLVKVERIPNNTFPIFWYKNNIIPVPFPRES